MELALQLLHKERKLAQQREQIRRLSAELSAVNSRYQRVMGELAEAARFVARLAKQRRRHLFTFLYHARVPPTNNHAERMIRPQVVARNTQGCNKSKAGADAHAMLGSILVSEKQRGGCPVQRLVRIVREPASPS